MGSSVFANKQGVTNKNSDATVISASDVCMTPMGSAMVPIPYTNMAKSGTLEQGSKTVKIDGASAANDGCCYKNSTGDQVGSGKGIVSHAVADKAEFIDWSPNVFIEGKGVCRNADHMILNAGNTPPAMNQDSSETPPVSQYEEKKDTFRIKVVEHLDWDTWEQNKHQYILCEEKNTPVKGIEFDVVKPDGSKSPETTGEDGMIVIKDQPRHGNGEITWKAANAKLNNSYLWFYRGIPIKLQGEKYPEDIKQEKTGKEINNHGIPTADMPKDKPKGAPIQLTVKKLPVGELNIIGIYRPQIIIDSHMHIESAHCAPMPGIWDKLPLLNWKLIEPARENIENFAKIAGQYLGNKTSNLLFMSSSALAAAFHMPEWLPFLAATSRKVGDKVEKRVTGAIESTGFIKASDLGKLSTFKVGEKFIEEQQRTFDYLQALPQYENRHLVFFGMLMTMDMEYAHLEGYFGLKVYNGIYDVTDTKMEKPKAYWYPCHDPSSPKGFDFIPQGDKAVLSPIDPVPGQNPDVVRKTMLQQHGVILPYKDLHTGTMGKMRIRFIPRLTDEQETKNYETWEKQLKYTELSVLANPLKVIPLFHYDPRRWQYHKQKESASSGVYSPPPTVGDGNLDPFKQVTGGGLYIGFKMYTAQGYRPWDVNRLPVMKDFYKKCEEQQIPIMNHCTPQGAYAYDRDSYLRFKHPMDTKEDETRKYSPAAANPKSAVSFGMGGMGVPRSLNPVDYFNNEFVSPQAWKPVLAKHKELRLCLAHFGGDTNTGREWGRQIIDLMKTYKNLYSDISSSFAEASFRDHFKKVITANPDLKSRILFGSDWYMIVMRFSGDMTYKKFCKDAKEFLDSFDTSLWVRFTLINPLRFYKLNDPTVLKRIVRNIVDKRKTEEVKITLEPLKKNEIEIIEQEAELIRKTYEIYKQYWEVPRDNRF